MIKLIKGLLFSFKNNPIFPKLKIVLKTSRMLKTNLIMILITILTKLGIWNKYTEPLFKKFGTLYSFCFKIWMIFNVLLIIYFTGTG